MRITLPLLLGTVLGLIGPIFAADVPVNQKAIDEVRAGRCQVARAAWWGFQPGESTKALQAAINSGAKKVIVEKMSGPWIVDQIQLASNQEIAVEPRVVVLAKRGAFHGHNDSLFNAWNKSHITLTGYGATLRMWRDDYASPAYSKAEWRDVLNIRGCTDVTIRGLTLAESGGDGVFLGSGRNHEPNKDVVVKDVTCDHNYRLGMAVINAENLLVENCVFKNAAGTDPQAGIDLEPDLPCERLVNCVVRNCVMENNHNYGFAIYPMPIRATSAPVSVRFENCITRGRNGFSGVISTWCGPQGPAHGTIELVGCRFEDYGTAGLIIGPNSVNGVKVRIADCTLADPSPKPRSEPPLVFVTRHYDIDDTGRVEFEHFTLKEKTNRPLMRFANGSGHRIRDLSGGLTVERDGKRTDYVVNQELVDRLMPVKETPVNKHAIADVRAGRCKVARASWWGFQPEESTKALQAAIDSGAEKVIVEKMNGPWIVQPIKLAANQELVFEKGVVVLAKKGAFHGPGDSLFSAANKSNIKLTGYGAPHTVLQMRRDDYANRKEYSKAEWRTALEFTSCTNVTISGMTLVESGGDGIYLGTSRANEPCRNIIIKDVICDRNYRQGISVINAENLLIENCVLKNTGGTSPRAGIDFEPNSPSERLVNCVMRNCAIENNEGYALQIYAPMFDATTAPVSMRFENCVTRGTNRGSVFITNSCGKKGPVRGTIEFSHCQFEDAGKAGITVACNSVRGVKIRFANCTLADASPKPTTEFPIVFACHAGDLDDIGGVDFADFTLKETTDRPLMKFYGIHGRRISGLSGSLTVERNGQRTNYVVDRAFVDRLMPAKPAAVNRQAIQKVLAKRCKVARAAWWGFRPEDSTPALQAAIDSGAEKVIVEKMDSPWIVDGIKLAADQELVFEKGVVVQAKKGAFHGPRDSLFSAQNTTNIKLTGHGATLQMHRADYAGPDYEKAEWRHVLNLHGCTNVKICGLTLAESGGDGIYLGAGRGGEPCKNVVIRDVICDRNYRQGISVISAENLLIENCVLKNTAGHNPRAGIDFEPNRRGERLVNCVMRNCRIENNEGCALVVYTPVFDGSTLPISMRIENCVTRGSNARSVRIVTSRGPKEPVRGTIDLVDCRFEDSGNAGITLDSTSLRGVKVRFANCTLADASPKATHVAPILFNSRKEDLDDIGGVEFANFTIKETAERPLMRFYNLSGRRIRNLSGCVTVDRNGKQTKFVVTQEFVDRLMPAKPAPVKPPKP
jgi:hypothetical protein